VYAGRNHYRPATGRISPLKPVGGGNGSIERVPPEDWIVVAQIPAIVSQEQFEMIQEKLKHNQSIASRNNTKHQYLLRAMGSPWAVPAGVYRTHDRYRPRLLRL
jgi:site-specific DNA recombinase